MPGRPFASARRSLRAGAGIAALVVAVLALTAGCSSSTSGGSDGRAATSASAQQVASRAPRAGTFTGLTFSADTARAGSGRVSVAKGGSVTAVAADGTVFTLRVPAGGVADDTVVRMVPLSHIEAGVATGPRFGVRLDPDGLVFVKPAELTITEPAGTARGTRLFFTATHSGTSPQPVLVNPTSAAPVLYLDHFSVAGELGVNDSGLDAAFGVAAGDRFIDAANQINELSQQLRADQLLGRDQDASALHSKILELQDQIDKEIVQPAIDAMAAQPTRCSAGRDVIQQIFKSNQVRQRFDLPPTNFEVQAATDALYENCKRQLTVLCKQTGDPTDLSRLLVERVRLYQLYGIPTQTAQQAAEEAVKTCNRAFTVEGGADEFHGSGVACNLSKPFTVTGSGVTVRFTPTSAVAGTYTYSGSISGFAVHGNGTYTVSADGEGGTLTATGPGTVDTPNGPVSNTGTEKYTLTPTTCAKGT